jgi:hypothetical protein
MPELEATSPDYPILVVAYDEKARAALAATPVACGFRALPCATFGEAEQHALYQKCRGVLVDLATMVKAKDEERSIAHTMTGLFPTLRVKSMGPMLIPMAMPGDAKQDKSLNAFFTKTCAEFLPRTFRSSKRKDICIPTRIGDARCFTLNMSWSGIFIVDVNPERYCVDEELTVTMLLDTDCEVDVKVRVVRTQSWGGRRPPGIGVEYKQLDQALESSLFTLLRSDKDKDRDRLV